MDLRERVASLAEMDEKLKSSGKSLGEAATKVSFIQPLLESLGWEVTDPDEVVLEHSVFGGTFLDYALLIEGQPRLYIEAKALRASLKDPSFIAQTVNYANSDGVRWCVLTNGLLYRIYKSDELASADKKLLGEADVRKASDVDALPNILATLSLLSKESVVSGFLDEWGERRFVDTAVRSALDQLLKEQAPPLINLVRKALGETKYTSQQVRDSLGRIGTQGPAAAQVLGPPPEPVPASPQDTPDCARTLKKILARKPKETIELFHQLDNQLAALRPGIDRRCLGSRISYWIEGGRYAAVWPRRHFVLLSLQVPLEQAKTMTGAQGREMIQATGHPDFINVRIHGPEELDFALKLATTSYSRIAGGK